MITAIYNRVLIPPTLLLEVAQSPIGDSAAGSISSQGGFINPPSDKEMDLALVYGLILLCVDGDVVTGYNRVVTHPDHVHQSICDEFRIDTSVRKINAESFVDWSGQNIRGSARTLTRVAWTDRQQAQIAFEAARTGLERRSTGRLVWALDAAVLPEYQKSGIGKKLVSEMNHELVPLYGFRAFRMFEVLRINDRDVEIPNAPSRKTFISSSTKPFAITEEAITLNDDVSLLVRWHHWLRHLGSTREFNTKTGSSNSRGQGIRSG
jgi:GNAT superfamily N-acetyltransferase